MAVNTERKGRLPLFDIALIAVVILAILGVAYVVTHRAETPEQELVYTVRIEGVENQYSGTFAEGGTLYSASGVAMGKIESVNVARAYEKRFDGTAADDDGEYRYTESRSSEKSDVTVTVRVTAEVFRHGYFVSGNRIAAGMQVETMVAGYLGEGVILTVEPAAEDAESK